MRDLNAQVAEWRSRMAAGGIKSPAVLDELESHLREEVEGLARSGVEEPRAFAIAAQKIGDSDLLQAEFAKVAGGKAARLGKVLGITCCLVALPLPFFALTTFVTARELPAVERALSLVAGEAHIPLGDFGQDRVAGRMCRVAVAAGYIAALMLAASPVSARQDF